MNAKGQMSTETMYKMIGSNSFKLPSDFDIDTEKELISNEIDLEFGNND